MSRAEPSLRIQCFDLESIDRSCDEVVITLTSNSNQTQEFVAIIYNRGLSTNVNKNSKSVVYREAFLADLANGCCNDAPTYNYFGAEGSFEIYLINYENVKLTVTVHIAHENAILEVESLGITNATLSMPDRNSYLM